MRSQHPVPPCSDPEGCAFQGLGDYVLGISLMVTGGVFAAIGTPLAVESYVTAPKEIEPGRSDVIYLPDR